MVGDGLQRQPDHGELCLLLLSHFSHVRLCATPEMTAHQAPPSLGFSRQEHWSGLPFPSPMKVKNESEVAQSCPTLSNPMDCRLPGSSVHGIFQARVLEWGAIAFSSNCSGTWLLIVLELLKTYASVSVGFGIAHTHNQYRWFFCDERCCKILKTELMGKTGLSRPPKLCS